MHRNSFSRRCIGRDIFIMNLRNMDAWKVISFPWEGRQGLTWMDSVIFLGETKGMHGAGGMDVKSTLWEG